MTTKAEFLKMSSGIIGTDLSDLADQRVKFNNQEAAQIYSQLSGDISGDQPAPVYGPFCRNAFNGGNYFWEVKFN
jgi:hypothetical protein